MRRIITGPAVGRLALVGIAPLALVIGLLALLQIRQERLALFAEQTRLSVEHHFAVAEVLAGAGRQLARMEARMRLSMAATPGIGDRAGELVPTEALGIAATEWAARAPDRGNLLGLPGLATQARGPVAAALELLAPLQVEALIGGSPSWSYFFSAERDFIAILPGAGLEDFLAAAPPVEDMRELIDYWLGYDVFRLGTPEENPDRSPYWTPPYSDAGGAGRMVSHGMPVYDGGRFVGIVATDITLDALARVLEHMQSPIGGFGLVTEAGDVLTGDARQAGRLAATSSTTNGAFTRRGADWELVRPFPGTPFRLVTVMSEEELRAQILPRLAGYGLVLAVAVASLAAIVLWLQRLYVGPGLRLAGYVEEAAAARGGDLPPPPAGLPPVWRERARAITAALASARDDRAALAASEERYRNVVNTQTEMVSRHTPEGRATFVNDAYCRQVGLSREEVLKLDNSLFGFVSPEDMAAHQAHMASLTPERPTATTTVKVWLPRAPGEAFWEEWTDTGIFDAAGRLVEIQSVGRDVTAKVRAEAELARQRAALHQSEKLAAMGSMLAGVAHELNNPLSIVVGYSGMLHELAEDEPTRRRAREIALAADRCARIVRTFLAMARARPTEQRHIDLETLIDQALELGAYGLRSNGIEIRRERAASLMIHADGDQIHQVLMNVILNAQQAMMEIDGPRSLSIRTGREAGKAVVEIADTGPGIPAGIAGRIFDPYFTTKPQGVGTGIGLAVSRGIVEAHGGGMEIATAAGGGALCRIWLPPLPDAATGPAEPARPGADAVKEQNRARLLVVDDEPAILGYILEALSLDGIEARAASNGETALRLAAAERFDAVLCDLRMPDMSGARLAERLAAVDPRLRGRILLMTGDALLAAAGELPAGLPVLEKPLDLAALRAALAPLLARQDATFTLAGEEGRAYSSR